MENIKEKQLVVKSNKLIEASYKLTLQEARIILLLTSMIQKDDQEFNLVRIKVKDFVDFVGVKDKDAYRRVQDITDSLGDKSLIVRGINPNNNERTRLKMQWLASAEYFEGSGFVELEFSQKLKPYLLQLKSRFTKYQLEYALKLRKSYSIRIYELLKQWEKLKTRTVEIAELKEALGIDKNKYTFYGDLKRRILNPAQKEISEKTDISFKFIEIKKGRKVLMIRFKIRSKKIDRPEIPSPPQVEKIKNAELYQRLVDYFCVNPKDALSILKNYPESQILENLAYAEHQYKKGKIKNIGPYTLKAVQKNYQHQMSLFDKEESEKIEKKNEKERLRIQKEKTKAAYRAYQQDEINKFKNTLSAEELEKIETECQQQVSKERKNNRLGLKTFVQFKIEACLAAKAGVMGFDEWTAKQTKF